MRVLEGVAIGLVVAVILLAQSCHVEHNERQDEIAYIRDVIVAARYRISEARAGEIVMLRQVQGQQLYSKRNRSRNEAQEEEWNKLIAKLSDVLAYRTSRITYEEKRELRKHFPGIYIYGTPLLGDGLDIIIINEIPIHYKDIFSQAEEIEWLDLPSAAHELMEKLIPAGRES